jgi:23S rRNA pseudouridine1911/1915/1917 synthase
MEVIFVDNHLLAAIKPAGLATQPTETDTEDFLTDAKQWVKSKYNKPGNVFLEPIHRLDKPVSGIVLFARTSKALSRLQAQMRGREMSKTYLALVEGTLPMSEGTLEHFLLHGSHRALVVSEKHPEGKKAILHYRVLNTVDKTTLVEITLETGRYHQIRAQFSAIGYPVVGDRKYGSELSWQQDAVALHHSKMQLKHPVTGVDLILENDKPLQAQKRKTRAS